MSPWLVVAAVAVVLVGSSWLAARRCADPDAPLLGRFAVGGMLGVPAGLVLVVVAVAAHTLAW